jgi:hypothetical protein
MALGGNFDYLKHAKGAQVERLRGFVLSPQLSAEEAEALISFQEKFDLALGFLLGRDDLSLDEIVQSLGVSPELALFLQEQVLKVRRGEHDLLSFVSSLNRAELQSSQLDAGALAQIGNFWTQYRVIQRVDAVGAAWEKRHDKSMLSREALQMLKRQLTTDFSQSQGIVRVMYDNLIPRIERLISALAE